MTVLKLKKNTNFPSVEEANERGLLAIGADLSVERLLMAYRSGIFPWFSYGQPIMWYAPPQRMVIFPKELIVSDSMKKIFQKNCFQLKKDYAFSEVIRCCAEVKRKGQYGTWITSDMQKAYILLHELGWAHSYEVYQNDKLVGGLYGIAMGDGFFGESMFSLVSNASKFAFISLVKELEMQSYLFIDCQMYTSHLASLGARLVPRKEFMDLLKIALEKERSAQKWT